MYLHNQNDSINECNSINRIELMNRCQHFIHLFDMELINDTMDNNDKLYLKMNSTKISGKFLLLNFILIDT